MEQVKKVIPYIRVGLAGGKLEHITHDASISEQKQALFKYCKENNLNPVRYFSDIASSSTFDRPGFKAMLTFIDNNEKGISSILITDWSRFSRNPGEAMGMIYKLRNLGIEVIAVNQPPLAEFLTANGVFQSELEFEYAHPCFKIHKDNMPEFASIIGETALEHHIDCIDNENLLIDVTYNMLNEIESNIISRLTEIEKRQEAEQKKKPLVNSSILK